MRVVPDEICFCMSTRLGVGGEVWGEPGNLGKIKKKAKLSQTHMHTCTLALIKCKGNKTTPKFKDVHSPVRVKCRGN